MTTKPKSRKGRGKAKVNDVPRSELLNMLAEIIGVLHYQPSVPSDHKTDLAHAYWKLACAWKPSMPKKRRKE